MATIVDELISILGYKIEGKEKLKKYKGGLDETEQAARRSAEKTAAAGRRIAVGLGLAATAGIALTKSAVLNYAGFERTLTRIGITAGASVEMTKAAGDEVQRLAKAYAMTTDEAIIGLDTLTASGLDLKEAMAFLPSVLATAQAAGASTADIANTAIKASSTLKIATVDMQKAFDIMVAGGKAGQFELKDMAQYIPTLANGFATLGYSGTDGLKQLIAVMQTLRERTGDAGTAATQASNIFGKMMSNQTIKAFSDFGINLEEGMKRGKAAGEDTLSTFVRLSKEALKGDMSKLPQLFTDQEFRLGMTTLITSADAIERFMKALNSGDVSGSTLRDLQRVLDDTEAKIQNLSSTWDNFMKSFGSRVAPVVSGVLQYATTEIDKGAAIDRGLDKAGIKGDFARSSWKLRNSLNDEERMRMARRGGYAESIAEAEASKVVPVEQYVSLGRGIRRPHTPTPDHAYPAAQRGAGQGGIGSDRAANREVTPPPMDKSWLDQILSAINADGEGPAQAMVTDNRTDARQFPVTVQAPISIGTINEAGAGAAVGRAIAGAVQTGAAAGAASVPARMQEGPAQ